MGKLADRLRLQETMLVRNMIMMEKSHTMMNIQPTAPRFGKLVSDIPEANKAAKNPVVKATLESLEGTLGDLHLKHEGGGQYAYHWDKIITSARYCIRDDASAALGQALGSVSTAVCLLDEHNKMLIRTLTQGMQEFRNLTDRWTQTISPLGRD